MEEGDLMKKVFFIFSILVLLSAAWAVSGQKARAVSSPASVKPDPDFGTLPLYFAPNRGQADAEALFYVQTPLYTLWITRQGLMFDSGREGGREISRLVFAGASPDVRVYAEQPTDHRVSYFIGDDPSRWRGGIPTSRAIVYEGVYRGIDLKVYGREREIEYDWVVRPGGDPCSIRLVLEGAGAVGLDDKGDIVIRRSFGEIRHRKPRAYQVIDGRERFVDAAFEVQRNKEIGLRLGRYSPAFDLVIDPLVLVSSTYLGGSATDYIVGMAVDGAGAVYTTGWTYSRNFPRKNPPQAKIAGSYDAFLTKLAPDGKSLVYSTYLGGAERDTGACVVVDGSGAAYVAGSSESTNFPVKNAIQEKNRGSEDGFITKVSPDGRSLAYSTYWGGAKEDACWGIALDPAGNLLVVGDSWSTNLPLKRPLQPANAGHRDAFLSKLSADGRKLLFSTYWGGSQSEYTTGSVCLDSSGAIYFQGVTFSDDFPVKAAFQSKFGGGYRDNFLAKISAACDRVIYATFLGGAKDEDSYALAVSPEGEAVVGGRSNSPNYPLKNPFQGALGGYMDAVITRFNADGRTLVFSTYLGGTGNDVINGIDLDAGGAVTVCGSTGSLNFPVKNAYQTVYGKGYGDAFLTRLSAPGTQLVFSSFLGGTSSDAAKQVVLGTDGTIYLAGVTSSKDFPLKGAFQKTNAGGDDVFIAKLKSATK